MDDEQNFRIRRSQPEMLPQLYEMLQKTQDLKMTLSLGTFIASVRKFHDAQKAFNVTALGKAYGEAMKSYCWLIDEELLEQNVHPFWIRASLNQLLPCQAETFRRLRKKLLRIVEEKEKRVGFRLGREPLNRHQYCTLSEAVSRVAPLAERLGSVVRIQKGLEEGSREGFGEEERSFWDFRQSKARYKKDLAAMKITLQRQGDAASEVALESALRRSGFRTSSRFYFNSEK